MEDPPFNWHSRRHVASGSFECRNGPACNAGRAAGGAGAVRHVAADIRTLHADGPAQLSGVWRSQLPVCREIHGGNAGGLDHGLRLRRRTRQGLGACSRGHREGGDPTAPGGIDRQHLLACRAADRRRTRYVHAEARRRSGEARERAGKIAGRAVQGRSHAGYRAPRKMGGRFTSSGVPTTR